MTSIDSLTLEVPDPTAASAFYTAAFGIGPQLDLRASHAPTSGFRGFTLSLVVGQPATVDGFVGAALDAGATALKPVKKSLWGYGGVVRTPDGTIWKVATSAKKNSSPDTRRIDDIVLLLGVADVAASKRFYVDARVQYFKASVDHLDGVLSFYEASAQYRLRPNIAFALGYTAMKAYVDSRQPGNGGYFNFNTKGPEFFVRVAF